MRAHTTPSARISTIDRTHLKKKTTQWRLHPHRATDRLDWLLRILSHIIRERSCGRTHQRRRLHQLRRLDSMVRRTGHLLCQHPHGEEIERGSRFRSSKDRISRVRAAEHDTKTCFWNRKRKINVLLQAKNTKMSCFLQCKKRIFSYICNRKHKIRKQQQ